MLGTVFAYVACVYTVHLVNAWQQPNETKYSPICIASWANSVDVRIYKFASECALAGMAAVVMINGAHGAPLI